MEHLRGLAVCISGSIPAPDDPIEFATRDVEIQLLVRVLAERILKCHGVVVHGAHPTFTPIIEGAVRATTGLDVQVEMFVAPFFFHDLPQPLEAWERFNNRYKPIKKINPIWKYFEFLENPDKWERLQEADQVRIRQEVLDEMRREMIARSKSLISIGGRPPRGNIVPGVDQEVELARQPSRPIPVYLLAGFGGETQSLYHSRYRTNPSELGNRLSNEENWALANERDIWKAAETVMQGLARIAERSR